LYPSPAGHLPGLCHPTKPAISPHTAPTSADRGRARGRGPPGAVACPPAVALGPQNAAAPRQFAVALRASCCYQRGNDSAES